MASDRVAVINLLANTPELRDQYESVFGTLPFQGTEAALKDSATPMGNQDQKQNWSELPAETQDKINIVLPMLERQSALINTHLSL